MIFELNKVLNLAKMKAKIIPIISILVLSILLFSSCEDSTYKEYKGNAPVYMSYDNLREAVALEQNVTLENPGKIYFKDNYIFIVEELKGIHVYDNSNPALPVKKVFVKLPGVVDISISGSVMYADSFVDLVVLDVQNIDNIHEVGRVKDILPYTVPPVENDYPMAYVDREKGVVAGWELKTIREKVDQAYNPYPIFWERGVYYDMINSGGASTGVSGSGVGAGGSMARFGIKDNALYVLDQNTLEVFDITDKTDPVKINNISAGWNVETMFLTEETMFLGTTTGMVIYDITDPFSPVSRRFFTHARSCDPVIVDDTLAYITLRTGTSCGGSLNSLTVVNVKNLDSPVQVSSYGMKNPHGLGKKGDLLFICDGSDGLKVYDASDPRHITNHLIYRYQNIDAFDVIPVGNILILIGDDGLYQYDYSNVTNISLLSSILVTSK
jgi:hypothetical protein